jgi:hypothetical protein
MHEKLPPFCMKEVSQEVRTTALKHAAQYVVDASRCGRTVHTTCCSHYNLSTCCSHDDRHDQNDIEAVDEVKVLILEAVNAWKKYKKRMPSTGTQGAPRSGHATRNVYSQLSGLKEDVGFNDFIIVK